MQIAKAGIASITQHIRFGYGRGVLILVWTMLLPSSGALSDEIGPAPISLEKDEVMAFDDLVMRNANIKTNGHRLVIIVRGDLSIVGKARLYSFDEAQAEATLNPAESGGAGVPSFNPGPNTEGPSPGTRGRDGGVGGRGQDGSVRSDGVTPRPITLHVKGSAKGQLSIENVGASGVNGQPGGNGGVGGNGEQGGRAVPNTKRIFGARITMGCARGPGQGGNGGAGGAAGDGGPAGRPGNGGQIVVSIAGAVRRLSLTGFVQEFFVVARSEGGQPGRPGQPGSPGAGGIGGYGGRGATGCEGRENERRGSTGTAGTNGQIGAMAGPGRSGTISTVPETILVRELPKKTAD